MVLRPTPPRPDRTTVVIGTLVAAMYGTTRPTEFTTTAEIVIDRIVDPDAEYRTLRSDAVGLETQIDIARSPIDATLLLVRWQETGADKAINALRELDGVGAKVAGAVLSQVDVKRQAQYGYAGVGSYYGKYQKYYVN